VVYLADEACGKGVSHNKKTAEQLAAQEACERFYI
jgi:dsRNA-specific ribonuclease